MTKINKIDNYKNIIKKINSILKVCKNDISKMATISCILSRELSYLYWTGFYLVSEKNLLTVGPYQGTLGCLNIPFGKGVCGDAALNEKTIIVPETHKYPGHIACDEKSLSEIVVPVFNSKNELIAVFDGDSDKINSFDDIDKKYLEEIMTTFKIEL